MAVPHHTDEPLLMQERHGDPLRWFGKRADHKIDRTFIEF